MIIEINLVWVLVYLVIGLMYNLVDQQHSNDIFMRDGLTKFIIAATIVIGWPIHCLFWVRWLYHWARGDLDDD